MIRFADRGAEGMIDSSVDLEGAKGGTQADRRPTDTRKSKFSFLFRGIAARSRFARRNVTLIEYTCSHSTSAIYK